MSKERIKQLNAEIARLSEEAKSDYAVMMTKSDNGAKSYQGWADDLQNWNNKIEAGKLKNVELQGLVEQLKLDEGLKEQAPKSANAPRGVQRKTLGQMVVENEKWDEYSQRKEIKALEIEFKDHFEGDPATPGPEGGALVWSDRRETPLMKPLRPITVLDIIPKLPTTSNLIEYVMEQDGYTDGAAITAEKATKPETNIRFERKSAKVVTIPHYVVVTEQLMEDAPRFRAVIDLRLLSGIDRKLESEVISGTNADFTGILNTAGIGARVHRTASRGLGTNADNPFDTIRYAIADMVMAFYRPSVIALNPDLSAKFDTEKDAQGRYVMSYDPVVKRMWGLTVAEGAGTVIPAATAIVLDPTMSCTLYDRRTRRIDVGWINDQFIKNQFCIRGEGRYAFTVEYPKGIEKVTGL